MSKIFMVIQWYLQAPLLWSSQVIQMKQHYYNHLTFNDANSNHMLAAEKQTISLQSLYIIYII